MFNATTFSLPSATQALKTELVGNVPEFRYGFARTDDRPVKDITSIAFGYMEGATKVRLGSVSTLQEDYILVISMDCENEYRATDTWDAIRFLKLLANNGHNWEKAEDVRRAAKA